MIALLILVVLLVLLLLFMAYLLGFRLAADRCRTELLRVRLEGAEASRQIHLATQQAFDTLINETLRHRRG